MSHEGSGPHAGPGPYHRPYWASLQMTMEKYRMAAPTRFPSGVTNVAKENPLGMFGMPDLTKFHVYFNDFDEDVVGWTETATSAGAGTSAAAIADADGGILRITTAANENDGLFLESQGESFLLETGKKAWIKARFALGDAIQSDFIIGLHSTDTTPLDAALRFAFISEDGSAALFFNCDDNTTDTDSDTLVTLEDDTFVSVAAYWDGVSTVALYVNDAHVTSLTDLSVPGAEMAMGIGYLNGAAGAETTDIDYLLVAKER